MVMEGHRGLERRNQAQNQKNESPTRKNSFVYVDLENVFVLHAGDGTIHRGTQN